MLISAKQQKKISKTDVKVKKNRKVPKIRKADGEISKTVGKNLLNRC